MTVDLNTVPRLKREKVEQIANSILKSAELKFDQKLEPPIDPEIIADNYLGLSLVYCDMAAEYGVDDLNGGLIISEKLILIDESQIEVHANFTIGHEVGHWVLHRTLVGNPSNQFSILHKQKMKETRSKRTMLCRASLNRTRCERQANWFSAALLMPSTYLEGAFRKISEHPLTFDRGTLDSFLPGKRKTFGKKDIREGTDDEWRVMEIINKVKRIGNFENVSSETMGIRLQELRLLIPMDESSSGF